MDGIMGGFKIGKGVHQSCISSSCLFSLYIQYIMSNGGMDEDKLD